MAAAACGARSTKNSCGPGGTISGPTMMGLTDFAMYVAILASIGPVPLAVTTNLNINFLRKPAPRDLIAEARLIKLGKRLAVGEVEIYCDGEDEMVAHATATYSIPPRDGLADGYIIPIFQAIVLYDNSTLDRALTRSSRGV